MTKPELRKTYIKKREGLPDAAYRQSNRDICERFFSFVDLSPIKVVHSFLPMTANKEFDTWLVIERAQKEFPHIRFSIPRINRKTDLLENFYYEGPQQLKANKWGILQPEQGELTAHEKIDVVIVPLLAFDPSGHRVGYGKGYYDRFLSTCRKDCQKIGVSFFPPVETIPGTTAHDFRLTACLTPGRTYVF